MVFFFECLFPVMYFLVYVFVVAELKKGEFFLKNQS
jgi:hypothetical protein